MKFNKLLALDIGGTAIKYAVFTDKLGESKHIPTPLDSLESLIAAIKSIVEEVGPVDGIAVSMPGTINTKTGYVSQGGALHYNAGVNFKEVLEESFEVPASIMNDAKSATLAEMRAGVLQGVQDGVVVLFGTGVGGGIEANGQILNGFNLQAGEFSYINANVDDLRNDDYFVGYFLGAHGLAHDIEVASGLKDMDGIKIFKEIRAGNEKVLAGMKEFCRKASWLFYNLQYIVDPEVFAIGGGISAEPMFLDLLNEALDNLVKDNDTNGLVRPTLKVCAHRNSANLLGAVFNFKDQHSEIE